ncbi:hypothetical protein J2X08_003802 [Rhizobium rosettiformans]|nr:hypothetical protein [Rhizobium rosettiformans]MDR7066284.1 hypothetical protein [Rhizobium rosettiformans]
MRRQRKRAQRPAELIHAMHAMPCQSYWGDSADTVVDNGQFTGVFGNTKKRYVTVNRR